MTKVLRSIVLALLLAWLLPQCAELACPPGQVLSDTACVCSNPAETVGANGTCVEPPGLCDGGGCPCTLEGIQAAIAIGGTQVLECAVDTVVNIEETVVIDNDVVLDGRGHLTLQGDNLVLLVDVHPFAVELVGITLQNGNQGIHVTAGATVTLTGCVVKKNVATASAGGGIHNEGQLTLANTAVEDNAVIGNEGGGGIYNAETGTLTLTDDSMVSGNEAVNGSGGGIRNIRGALVLDASRVSKNIASEDGGGITNNGRVTLLNGTTVSGNRVSDNGGGIYNGFEGIVSITQSTVESNRATHEINNGQGGGIYSNTTATLTIGTGTKVSMNEAILGGGIYTRGNTTVTNTTISDNTAEHDAGGIYNNSGGTLMITESTLSGNSAGLDGGGVYNRGTVQATNCTLSSNIATDEGGALYHRTGDLTLAQSTFSDNVATKDGSAIGNDGELTLVNSVVDGTCRLDDDAVTLGQGNIESPGNTCALSDSGNQLGVDSSELNLGPLQDNQGPTLTHAPVVPSVAIDAIAVPACVDAVGDPLLTDQRGVSRPKGAQCDVGAVEVEDAP